MNPDFDDNDLPDFDDADYGDYAERDDDNGYDDPGDMDGDHESALESVYGPSDDYDDYDDYGDF